MRSRMTLIPHGLVALAMLALLGAVWIALAGPGRVIYRPGSGTEWSAGALLVLATVGMLVKRLRKGPLTGRWTLWSFVVAIAFLVPGGVQALIGGAGILAWVSPMTVGLVFLVFAAEAIKVVLE